MKEIILNRALKLFSVKSIVTIILTVVFAVLAIRGDVSSDQFITIFSVVVAFYFGTQTQRAASSSGETALPDTDQKKE